MKEKNSAESRLLERTPDPVPTAPEPKQYLPGQQPTTPDSQDDEKRHARIRELAYRLYEERGRVDGHDVEDWLQAESIISAGGQLAA